MRGELDTRHKALEEMIVPATLRVRIGCLVMLTKNLDHSLINGSTGKVIGFCSPRMFQQDDDGHWIGQAGLGLPLCQSSRLEAERESSPRPRKKTKREESTEDVPFPVVRFLTDDDRMIDRLMTRIVVRSEWADGKLKASREQIPLTLGWALSIHKSQGQSESS